MKGIGRGLTDVLPQSLPGRTGESHEKSHVKITDISAQIRTKYCFTELHIDQKLLSVIYDIMEWRKFNFDMYISEPVMKQLSRKLNHVLDEISTNDFNIGSAPEAMHL